MKYISNLFKKKWLVVPEADRKKIKEKVSFFSLIFLVTFSSINTQAQTVITHDIATANLYIPGASADNYIVTGTTESNSITVRPGYKGSITLKNVSITGSSFNSCITIEGENNRNNSDPVTKVDLILDGTNNITFTSSAYCAIQVNQGAQIHIRAIDPNDNDSGILNAKSTPYEPGINSTDAGAGIGAKNYSSEGNSQITCASGNPGRTDTAGGNVIISSGKVTAWGGGHSAGIGGGWYSYYNGYIVIYGGEVEARSSFHAAGIGSGCPQGTGVTNCFAENSTILALPPAKIDSYGTGSSNVQNPNLGLTGAQNITYINDQNKTEITVHTVDYEPFADIYLDLTETPNLVDVFSVLEIDYDLTKVKIGTTDESGILKFRAQLEQNTTFFTDASSSGETSGGRPYLPVVTTVVGGVDNKVEIVLPLLSADISFKEYSSTPLETGYTPQEALQNAYTLKMDYHDTSPMTNMTFKLQINEDFNSLIFLASDSTTVVEAPKTLNNGDTYYIILPVNHGKLAGIYNDVLLINGEWENFLLPGYIRRVGEQKVITDDSGINSYIRVTASPDKFVATHPADTTVNIVLNINHLGTTVPYNKNDVKAKYLISAKADYKEALAEIPLINWSSLNIPDRENLDQITEIPFNSIPKGTYYIHWNVESEFIYAHSLTVIDPPAQYGGFGPYIVTDHLFPGNITGNPFVCIGQSPSTIVGEESAGGSGDFTYQWQGSDNRLTNWSNVGVSTKDYNPPILSAPSVYYRRLTHDNRYGMTAYSNVFKIEVAAENQTLYWNRNAFDNNWNNPANWTNESGTVQNMVPLSCSNIYIPGGLTLYPSLNPQDTPTDVFGDPMCNEITFAFGSELAYQHRLIYNKAFVQYDFGYYTDIAQRNESVGLTSNALRRDKWYPIAAPLKKMVSGDFSFGGYPFTWQAMPDGILEEDYFYSIWFEKSYSDNGVDLSTTNNCIAVKIAPNKTALIGYDNHKHLQSLSGILTIPYFENQEEKNYHPGHSYDPILKMSFLYNYNRTTLQTVYNQAGKIKRASEAYRFVFENDNNSVENILMNGEEVPCYVMTVSPNNEYKHALIGNPLLASINMKRFHEANTDVLANSGFHRYDNQLGATGAWLTNPYAENFPINSFEGFVVYFKSNAANQKLFFPLEGEYALTGSTTNSTPRKADISEGLSINISNELNQRTVTAELVHSSQLRKFDENVRKLISEDCSNPEIFIIDNSNYNIIQTFSDNDSFINLGIRCSDTRSRLKLKFNNIKDFFTVNKKSVILHDTYLNIEQDLSMNPEYSFVMNKSALDGQSVDANRFKLLFRDQKDFTHPDGNNITATYINGNLKIESSFKMNTVSLYDIQGHLIHKANKIEDTEYRKNLFLNNNQVYVLKVETISGEIKSIKFITGSS